MSRVCRRILSMLVNSATISIDKAMNTFSEWVAETHPESLDEGFWRNALLAGTLAAGSFMGHGVQGAEPVAKPDAGRAAATSRADQARQDVEERGGWVYVTGRVRKPTGDRLKDAKLADSDIMVKAAKYFQSKGGRPGFVPGGYKEVKTKSDFMNGKSDVITFAWKVSR